MLVVVFTHIFVYQNGTTIYYTNDPREAVKGADVIVTDTFVSMGAEHEKTQRLKDFQGYQVDRSVSKVYRETCPILVSDINRIMITYHRLYNFIHSSPYLVELTLVLLSQAHKPSPCYKLGS